MDLDIDSIFRSVAKFGGSDGGRAAKRREVGPYARSAHLLQAPSLHSPPLSHADAPISLPLHLTPLQCAGATSFEGRDKKRWEAKTLESLGVQVKNKVKMPYKMFKGVSKARKEREEKAAQEAKLAGIVTARPGETGGSSNKRAKKEGGGRGERNRQAEDEPVPDNIRGPVMHLKRR
jgi:hypothetical protein